VLDSILRVATVVGSVASMAVWLLFVDAMGTLRDFWSKHGEDILIIGVSMIVVLGLFLLGAYLMTRYY
jgi:flagellar biogenesis protein FliO